MPRPISVTVHLDAMRHNLARMRQAAADRMLWAVVKANAYGHGLENAIEGFADADGLALLDISDAVKARQCGWKKRILLLEGFFEAEDIAVCDQYNIETIIHSHWMIEALKNASFKHIRVHIKINSGMNRLGFLGIEGREVHSMLSSIPGVEPMGFVTHFANGEPTYLADGPATVAKQLTRMGILRYQNGVCMANSAALLFHPEVEGDAVRAGIALYGVSPDGKLSSAELDIRPAMTLSSRILAIQDIAPGEAVGYGSRWVAKRPSRIAVVACGYADGYPRTMPDGAPTYVEGQIAPLVGAVSMDMLEIDVTDIAQAQVGSQVELWGEHIHINELAHLCGTIGYELMCAIAPRVPVRAG